MDIKALTIKQPWASLLANGHKQYETRSWSTKYRGSIAIHAAKSQSVIISGITVPGITTLGAVIATAKLVECYEIIACPHYPTGLGFFKNDDFIRITEDEQYLGNWKVGNYAWEITDIQLLENPIPAKGCLGIWNWTIPEQVEMET